MERIYGVLMLYALLLSRHRRRIYCTQTVAVFTFLAAIGLSFYFSYRPELAWAEFYKYCTLVVFYVVLLAIIKNENQLRSFVIVYICTMVVYQLLCLREFLLFGRGSWSGGMWRMVGFDTMFGHPNSVAASILFSMPFAFGILKGDTRIRARLGIAAYSALSLGSIILTGSRSGLLGYLLVCLLYVLSQRGLKRKLYGIAALSVLLMVAWPLIPADKQARIRTLLGEQMDSGAQWSAEQRMKGWGFWQGLRMLRDRPVLGVGMGCFAHYSEERLDGRKHDSHNLYGEVLGQLGIVGTIAFAFMVAIIFKNVVFVIKEVRRGDLSPASPIAWVSWAIVIMLFLLLFEGWASHNLYRYSWLWAAAMGALARSFAVSRKASEESSTSQAGRRGVRGVVPASMASKQS